MVKPESLLLLLLSSSGLELGLLEEAEAGPIRGSENTSGKRARLSPFPDVLLRVRSGWAWLERGALAPPPPSSLETRMKSSELPSSAGPGTSEEACGAQPGAQDESTHQQARELRGAQELHRKLPPRPVLLLGKTPGAPPLKLNAGSRGKGADMLIQGLLGWQFRKQPAGYRQIPISFSWHLPGKSRILLSFNTSPVSGDEDSVLCQRVVTEL